MSIESEMVAMIKRHQKEVEEFERNKQPGVIYDIDMNTMYHRTSNSTINFKPKGE